MLAVRDEEVFVVAMAFTFVTFMVWYSLRVKERHKRLEVIQKALDHPNLDAETRRSLLDTLSQDHRHRSEWVGALGQQLAWLARNLVFVGGWITMFVGGGICVVGWIFHGYRTTIEEGAIAAFVGLGLVTVPIALRELELRRHRDRA